MRRLPDIAAGQIYNFNVTWCARFGVPGIYFDISCTRSSRRLVNWPARFMLLEAALLPHGTSSDQCAKLRDDGKGP